MKVYWCDQLLQRCPITGTVAEPPVPQPCPVQPLDPTCDPFNVVLSGAGLTNARVREQAEFIMDGSKAGPGSFCFRFCDRFIAALYSKLAGRNNPLSLEPSGMHGGHVDLHGAPRVNVAHLKYTRYKH